MTTCLRPRVWLGLVACLGFAIATHAQEIPTPKPTKHHALLTKEVGVWDAEIKAYMGPPGTEPAISKGVEENHMLGDLWLISSFTGDFGGVDFKGHGQNGFDTQKNKFVATWVDTMTTSPMILEGTFDEATGELTLTGESFDSITNTKMQVKNVSKHNADGTRTFTMYMKGDATGGEFVKMMEITYKKRASAK